MRASSSTEKINPYEKKCECRHIKNSNTFSARCLRITNTLLTITLLAVAIVGVFGFMKAETMGLALIALGTCRVPISISQASKNLCFAANACGLLILTGALSAPASGSIFLISFVLILVKDVRQSTQPKEV